MNIETCTYQNCNAASAHKGEKNGWIYFLCRKHKEMMLPLLSNKNLAAQQAEKREPVSARR